jgi:hypothetical protein
LTLAVPDYKLRAMRVAALASQVTWLVMGATWLVMGCSSAETAEPDGMPSASAQGDQTESMSENTDSPSAAPDQTTVEALSPTIVVFADPDTEFATADVYDATREIVRFDAERQAMVSAATGDAVSGWMTSGNDLGPFGSFRVRFGSEGGQRRAYFTETGNGTICDLVLSGPEELDIYATRERPPVD